MRSQRTRAVASALAAAIALAFALPSASIALNDPEYAKQWGMERIGAKAAWDAGLFGEGIDIAVVDSGVHLTHQDLQANVIAGYDFVNDDERAQDDNEHGTHVAGIAAAVIDNGGVVGVAPKARIIPVKVLDENFVTVGSDIGAGIRWAVDHGAEVINLSLGSVAQEAFGPPAQSAVAYAWSKGVICVFAAGNDYVLDSGFEDEHAIVVSSTDRNDAKSSFSSGVGSARWGLAAPGSDVFSTIWVSDERTNTYAPLSGTSMSAPHVAGAAAILRGAGLSPQQTVDRLLGTAKDLGVPGPDRQFGYGRLDVAKAVAGLGGSGATTSPAPAPTAATSSPTTSASGPPATTAGSPRRTTPPPAGTPSAPTTAAAPTTVAEPPVTPPTDVETTTTVDPATTGSTIEELDVAAPAPRRPVTDGGAPAILVAVAAVAALATGGAAGWLVWRRRADSSR